MLQKYIYQQHYDRRPMNPTQNQANLLHIFSAPTPKYHARLHNKLGTTDSSLRLTLNPVSGRFLLVGCQRCLIRQIFTYCVWHPTLTCGTLVEIHCDKAIRSPMFLPINGFDLLKKCVASFRPCLYEQSIDRRVIPAGDTCGPADH